MPRRREAAGLHPRTFQRAIRKLVGCQYLVFLPKDYDGSRKRWPLILFLHGAGERGKKLDLVKKHGPPKIVEQQPDFPFIVISPQCAAKEWWSTDVLTALLDEVMEDYRVDPRRVYLTGLSMGGYGAWSLAMACPERFAAVVPICGGGNRLLAHKLKGVPVWAFHGAKDDVVPVRESKKMVDAVCEAGGDARLTVYPDTGHDSWTATYDSPKLYEWLLAHTKPPRRKLKPSAEGKE